MEIRRIASGTEWSELLCALLISSAPFWIFSGARAYSTGLENATEYVVSDKSQKGIEEGLLEGDTIIVTGNLNLAHEAAVKVSD